MMTKLSMKLSMPLSVTLVAAALIAVAGPARAAGCDRLSRPFMVGPSAGELHSPGWFSDVLEIPGSVDVVDTYGDELIGFGGEGIYPGSVMRLRSWGVDNTYEDFDLPAADANCLVAGWDYLFQVYGPYPSGTYLMELSWKRYPDGGQWTMVDVVYLRHHSRSGRSAATARIMTLGDPTEVVPLRKGGCHCADLRIQSDAWPSRISSQPDTPV